MTELEPTTKPTCPICATNVAIERDRGRWLCTSCWTVFNGSQDEWRRSQDLREHYAKQQRAKVTEDTIA